VETINKDVEFKNGRVIVREEEEIIGKKRRRDNRDED